MSIREFRWPDDYASIVELWQACDMYNPASDGLADLREVCERNPGLFLLAEEPECEAEPRGVVGSVIGTFDGRRGYIYHVAVHPDCQREGYGRALLQEVERRIWALGAPKVRLMVLKENNGAIAFYKALGYTVDKHAVPMSKVRPQELKGLPETS